MSPPGILQASQEGSSSGPSSDGIVNGEAVSHGNHNGVKDNTAVKSETINGNGKPKATIQPTADFHPSSGPENTRVQSIVKALSLVPHVEGGYFSVTDLHPLSLPSPYPPTAVSSRTMSLVASFNPSGGIVPPTRLLSTTIYYYLTPNRPMGSFHSNRSRIIHTLHKGRGRYVLIDPRTGEVETFVVGQDVEKGEKLQWVVEGGLYKASYLLKKDDGEGEDSEGLLISETVVPGFDYADHEFLEEKRLRELVSAEQADALKWLVRDHDEHE